MALAHECLPHDVMDCAVRQDDSVHAGTGGRAGEELPPVPLDP
jgi:hypothetical protein